MVTLLTSEMQDALEPFIPDDLFFRLNPELDLRIRFWRNEDEDRVTGYLGSELEPFWLVGAWRDGSLSYKMFPFYPGLSQKNREDWFEKFKLEYYAWITLIVTSPYFRRMNPQW